MRCKIPMSKSSVHSWMIARGNWDNVSKAHTTNASALMAAQRFFFPIRLQEVQVLPATTNVNISGSTCDKFGIILHTKPHTTTQNYCNDASQNTEMQGMCAHAHAQCCMQHEHRSARVGLHARVALTKVARNIQQLYPPAAGHASHKPGDI